MSTTASTRGKSSNQYFDFFGLPRELRDQIYKILFFRADVCECSQDCRHLPFLYSASVRRESEFHRPQLGLRQTCRNAMLEFDQMIGFHTDLVCLTDFTEVPKGTKFRPMPVILNRLVEKMRLKFRRSPCRREESGRPVLVECIFRACAKSPLACTQEHLVHYCVRPGTRKNCASWRLTSIPICLKMSEFNGVVQAISRHYSTLCKLFLKRN